MKRLDASLATSAELKVHVLKANRRIARLEAAKQKLFHCLAYGSIFTIERHLSDLRMTIERIDDIIYELTYYVDGLQFEYHARARESAHALRSTSDNTPDLSIIGYH